MLNLPDCLRYVAVVVNQAESVFVYCGITLCQGIILVSVKLSNVYLLLNGTCMHEMERNYI